MWGTLLSRPYLYGRAATVAPRAVHAVGFATIADSPSGVAAPNAAAKWRWMALVVTPKKTREYHLDDKRYGSAAEAHASGLQRLSFWKRHPNLNLQLLVKKGRAPALQTRILFFTAVGMRYRGNHTFSETDVVTLRKEPTNPHDRNAVQILVGGQPVAYVLATDCAAVHSVLNKRYEVRFVKHFDNSAVFALVLS